MEELKVAAEGLELSEDGGEVATQLMTGCGLMQTYMVSEIC